jgi:lysylphosphatidylglycerol synthetase-like protein (DUF2156 family)
MAKISKAYDYAFYKFYKSFEASPSRFWSEWKASLLMDVLVGCIIFSSSLAYEVATKKTSIVFSSIKAIWVLVIAIVASNYFIFNHTDRWKKIVSEFDKLPKKQNLIGGIVFWILFALIISSVIFMFYLMSKIDWGESR